MVTSPRSNRKYTGKSLIEFDSGIKLDCEYVLDLSESNGGNMVIHCNVPVPTKFQKLEKVIKLLVRQLDENNELNFASINGNTTKPDGKIFIEKCILDHTHVNIRPKGNNSQISCPQIDLKDVEPQVLGLLNKLAKGFNVDVTNLSENITGEITLDFIVDSNVKIIFHELSQDEFVSSIYGLTNFQFGPVEYTRNNLSQPCEFEICVEQTKIHFIRIHNYSDVLSRLKTATINVEVTADAIIVARFNEIPIKNQIIDRVCILLSYADCNWITPLYNDIFKEGILMQTTLYDTKTYPFVKSQSIIETIQDPNVHIRQFIETAFHKYDNMNEDFNIYDVIEYYVSAASNYNMHQRFLIGYIALQSLSSNIKKYADKEIEQIRNNSVKLTENKLLAALGNAGIVIPLDIVKNIADNLTTKGIGERDNQRCLVKKFGVNFTDKQILDLYLTRNELFHSGGHNADSLFPKLDILFDLLDRIILSGLGWRNRQYHSKPHRRNLIAL